MHRDIDRVIISESAIRARVAGLADELADRFADTRDGIVLVTILAGSVIFLADLIRRLPMKMRIGLITVSSYPGATTRSHGAILASASLPDLRGRDVLIVDDILDTGGTLRLVQQQVRRAEARRMTTAVLLRKRASAPEDLPVEFVGFDIEDEFVVGYGLDFNGLYRNLPYIAVLKPDLYEEESRR